MVHYLRGVLWGCWLLDCGVLGGSEKDVVFGVYWGCLWDFAPLWCCMELSGCLLVFYFVFSGCEVCLFKWLIMSVSKLLVILWWGIVVE